MPYHVEISGFFLEGFDFQGQGVARWLQEGFLEFPISKVKSNDIGIQSEKDYHTCLENLILVFLTLNIFHEV